MICEITLYTRKDCCLCDEMKEVVRRVAEKVPLEMHEVDVDSSADLKESYGEEVPVLFINGRKAFKVRVAATDLKKRLRREADLMRKG